jgi:hypothetical protein
LSLTIKIFYFEVISFVRWITACLCFNIFLRTLAADGFSIFLQLPEKNERGKRIIFCKLSRIIKVEKAAHPRLNEVTFAIVISDIGRVETPSGLLECS